MQSSDGARASVPPAADAEAGVARARRLLWVTEEPPDHSLGGGNIRQAYLFEALARAFPTDLLVVGRVTDDGVRTAAARVIEVPASTSLATEHPIGRRLLALAVALGSAYPLQMYPGRPGRRVLSGHLASDAQDYDLVCIEHEALAPLAPASHTEPWVITFHHVLSGMIEKESALARGRRQRWIQRRDLKKARRLEKLALRLYDRCLVCSDADAARLEALGGSESSQRIAVVPNGVDLSRFRPRPVPADPCVLLPGTLAWGPNVDGAVWFCNEIWPDVRAAVPRASLILAGRSPVTEVLELGRLPGVSVHADVQSMVPFFESARVVVVPLRVGTGTRIKALEAMAAARPVVGTTIGLDGLDAIDGVHVRIADDSRSMARVVAEVLTHDDLAHSLASAGRAHVESRFGWDQIGERFVATISQVLDRSRAAQTDARSASKSA